MIYMTVKIKDKEYTLTDPDNEVLVLVLQELIESIKLLTRRIK